MPDPSGSITDKVAKESDHSGASDHPIHEQKAHANDHQSKGPAIAEDIGKPASKEELKKRSEELNK
ncbi:hypothetical protein EJ08DRAFT_652822 [Tothia fuscella]|uniref:Uncharacterized protein n=1 Tax=Tothia fuscella TaxID=1048955 RepID=A0A9P4TUC2_9PEZI|nr:hypothetical protein EJ08DRAFT_652822 [Tothia fuscella]